MPYRILNRNSFHLLEESECSVDISELPPVVFAALRAFAGKAGNVRSVWIFEEHANVGNFKMTEQFLDSVVLQCLELF